MGSDIFGNQPCIYFSNIVKEYLIYNISHLKQRQNEIDFHFGELSIEDFRLKGMLMELTSHLYGKYVYLYVHRVR